MTSDSLDLSGYGNSDQQDGAMPPTGGLQACVIAEQAARCRRLAMELDDTRTVATLTAMAAEYEMQARRLQQD